MITLLRIHPSVASLWTQRLRSKATMVALPFLCVTAGRVALAQSGTLQSAYQTVTVDPSAKTATVRFTSHAHDSVTVDLSVQYASPDSTGATPAKNDSLAKLWSLAPWIKDLSQKATIAPHETVTLVLHLTVPDKLAPGDYSAYVVATQVKPAASSGTIIGTLGGADGIDLSKLMMGGSGNGAQGKGADAAQKVSTKVVYHVK